MAFWRSSWSPILLLVGACANGSGLLTSEGSDASPAADSGVEEPSTCSPPASDMCAAPGPSYASDVVPILDKRCNNCHAENNDGGPWPLGGYDDVNAWRDTIMNDLLRCTMPPADAGVTMPNDERAILMAWIICGAPDN